MHSNHAPINSVAALPTGRQTNGLKVSLGQVLAKGRDNPSGLYPLTTRNDVERQVGYIGPDTNLWAITGPPTEQQNTGITSARNLTAPSIASSVVAGHIAQVGPSQQPMRIGKYTWTVEDRFNGINEGRPRGVLAPYVRSGLDDQMLKNAVDYNVRGNLAYNEWQTALPHVFEQGNGFAISGPPYASSSVNVDTF